MLPLPSLGFRRVRDKHESELKELEESERNMQEKYNNMKVRARSIAFRELIFTFRHIEDGKNCARNKVSVWGKKPGIRCPKI